MRPQYLKLINGRLSFKNTSFSALSGRSLLRRSSYTCPAVLKNAFTLDTAGWWAQVSFLLLKFCTMPHKCPPSPPVSLSAVDVEETEVNEEHEGCSDAVVPAVTPTDRPDCDWGAWRVKVIALFSTLLLTVSRAASVFRNANLNLGSSAVAQVATSLANRGSNLSVMAAISPA
ncbi:hypothetical protein Btru_068321 [Bulinus truncatus]|nr:hypothetical protein Btru_068321 [Bulinus truncatus]